MRLRPRLSAVLLTVNLAVIALPFGSIFFFRIYENQLIQETERELISQAALIGAIYRQFLVGSEGTALAAQARAARSAVLLDYLAPAGDLAAEARSNLR